MFCACTAQFVSDLFGNHVVGFLMMRQLILSACFRFWKMADTFTGLKLQGELGKFGRTEITDIEGYVELPDGKVLSGCEWGNMLLWDGGLIKVEIQRKNKKSCHQGPIQQILLDEGELMTIGVDGYIRVCLCLCNL